jgi:hypothetical protein
MATDVIDRDLGYKKIVKETKALDATSTNVGLFGSGGNPSDDMAARATVMEFGSSRWKDTRGFPFIRQAFHNNLKSLQKVVQVWYGRVLDRKVESRKALENIGEWFTGKVKEEITNGSFRGLSIDTIIAKGSAKPLIDTGDLRRRVEHKERKD